jgi:hypothetical protein
MSWYHYMVVSMKGISSQMNTTAFHNTLNG